MNTYSDSPQLFNLKWRNYQTHMMAVFEKILLTESFSDVTLVLADVEQDTTHAIKAHKIILGASSPYFEMVFSEHPCQHPVVVMPPDVKLEDIQHVLHFVYRGEVQVRRQHSATNFIFGLFIFIFSSFVEKANNISIAHIFAELVVFGQRGLE